MGKREADTATAIQQAWEGLELGQDISVCLFSFLFEGWLEALLWLVDERTMVAT